MTIFYFYQTDLANVRKDAEKWQSKCEYLKKCLADTEMKLSDAFREISALRMDRDVTPTPTAATDTAAEKVHIVKRQEGRIYTDILYYKKSINRFSKRKLTKHQLHGCFIRASMGSSF